MLGSVYELRPHTFLDSSLSDSVSPGDPEGRGPTISQEIHGMRRGIGRGRKGRVSPVPKPCWIAKMQFMSIISICCVCNSKNVYSQSTTRRQRRREAPFPACPGYAAPVSSEDPLCKSTILPVTPPFPSSSCACLASARGNRRAISGLIFRCWRRSSRAIKSCRNHAGFSRLSVWML